MDQTNEDSSPPLVTVEGLSKVFGDAPRTALPLMEQGLEQQRVFAESGQTVAVWEATFEVQANEIFVIMGLSGCGKSTLLRMLNRLIEPTTGKVLLGDRDITAMDRKELIHLRRTEIAMVFQSFALMPHLRVWENAAFGLEVAGLSRKERRNHALQALEQVGLQANADSFPSELSGGMQQRVGLARALAVNPRILLMDEAFSALDPLIRSQMQEELVKLQQERDLTVIFISHDLDEAMKIGNRIGIMQGGRVVQVGSPEAILHDPENDYVKSFFEGVDISHVYTAGDLAGRHPSIVTWQQSGLEDVLQHLERKQLRYAILQNEQSKFLGVASIDALRTWQTTHRNSSLPQLEPIDPLPSQADFDSLLAQVASSKCPVPVIDHGGKLQGAVGKTKLLSTLKSGIAD